jgi:hypothetical protein
MKQFANIVSVFVLSGAACFAAMGCAAASGDGSVDDEDVSAAPPERLEGVGVQGIESSRGPGKELAKPPATGHEKAPAPSKSPSELNKKVPSVESVKAPPESKIPSAGQFSKKVPGK